MGRCYFGDKVDGPRFCRRGLVLQLTQPLPSNIDPSLIKVDLSPSSTPISSFRICLIVNMPAPEVTQPKAQTMDVPSAKEIQEQPVCDNALTRLTIFSIQS